MPSSTPTPYAPRRDTAEDYFADPETYHKLVMVAWRLLGTGRVNDAQDIVHRAFEECQKHWPGVEDPKCYVVTVILHLTHREGRREQRDRVLLERAATLAAPGNQDGPDPVQMERNWSVDHAVRALPRRQRQCVVLNHYYGLSQREIAKLLGVHHGTVERHLRTADEKLRQALADLHPARRQPEPVIELAQGEAV